MNKNFVLSSRKETSGYIFIELKNKHSQINISINTISNKIYRVHIRDKKGCYSYSSLYKEGKPLPKKYQQIVDEILVLEIL